MLSVQESSQAKANLLTMVRNTEQFFLRTIQFRIVELETEYYWEQGRIGNKVVLRHGRCNIFCLVGWGETSGARKAIRIPLNPNRLPKDHKISYLVNCVDIISKLTPFLDWI